MTEAEGRKPRAKSEFILMGPMPAGDKFVREILATGATDKELMAKAIELGAGEYEIHYVRRKFKVATKTQTVIE